MAGDLTPERLAAIRKAASKGYVDRHEVLALCDTIDAQAAVIAEAAQVMREVSNELHFAAPAAFALARVRLCETADRCRGADGA